MAGHTHLMCRNLWPATWWNKCLFGFLVSLFVARKTTRFSLKPFVSRNVSSLFPHELWPAILAYKLPSPFIKSTNVVLERNPKFSREEKQSVWRILNPKKNSKRKECSREKRKENSYHLDFRSKPGNLKCWDSHQYRSPLTRAPTRTPSGEIGPEDSWPRVLKDPIITCRKIDLQCKFRNLSLYLIIVI